MTRKEVYLLIKSAVDSLKVQHEFRRGRISELSSLNDKFPVVWYETSDDSSTPATELSQNSLPIDQWPVNLHIALLDREDSVPEQYEDLIDQCDAVAQTIAFKINSVVSESDLLTLSGLSRTPFIKKLASSATGVLLTFTLTSPDTTDQSENCD